MNRYAGVVAPAAPADPLALAMLEDVVDLLAAMQQLDACLLLPPDADPRARDVTWPGMPVVPAGSRDVAALLTALGQAGADEAVAVAPDVPDLPPLLLGKLHSALTSAQAAVCPAADGRLVAVATRLPAPQWLDVTLDTPEALALLRAAAPPRGLTVGPGWHRVASYDEAQRLDPGLEGWEATRALLGR